MANLHTLSNFQKLVDERVREVFDGDIAEYAPGKIAELYNVVPTDRPIEEYFSVDGLPDIPEFNGTLAFLGRTPGYSTKIEQKEYAAGMAIERKLHDFKKFHVLDNMGSDLAASLNRTREKKAVRPFANAFSAAFDYMTSEEGVALCSTAHTSKMPGVSTASGFSNAGTTALSKSAIAAARLAGKRFRLGNGELAAVNLDTLIVPSSLYDSALEYTGYDPRSGANSELDPDTANNKINIARGIKVIEWTFLDDYDTNNWFMVDSKLMKKSLLWQDSQAAEIASQVDFYTKAIESSVYSRWANGFTNWRWIYGSNVS